MRMGSFQKFCLRWNNHTSNFVGSLGSLLNSENYSDVTVCCQGQVWHLHKLVLSAASCHFEQLLSSIPIGLTPAIILDGPASSDISALIHFIYHGEVNVDQENLPSLLKTAASLKIKGLADVSSLGELGSNCSDISNDENFIGQFTDIDSQFPLVGGAICKKVAGLLGFGNDANEDSSYENLEGTTSISAIVEEAEDVEVSPLNLSCNSRRNEDLELKEVKEEFKSPPYSIDGLGKEETTTFQELRPMKVDCAEPLESTYYPPPKRIRTGIPTDPEAHVIHAETQTTSHLKYATLLKNLTPSSSYMIRSPPDCCSVHMSLKEEPNHDVMPIRTAIGTQTIIELHEKHDSEPTTIVIPQIKSPSVPIETEAPVNQIPILATTSFPMPLLNMTLSNNTSLITPHSTYQQSSSISSGNSCAQPNSTNANVCSTSNVSMNRMTCSLANVNADSSAANACSTYSTNKDQSSAKVSETLVISEEVQQNQNPAIRQASLPKYADASVGPAEQTETTFTHKKFSPCTIPKTPNTVHIVRGVYNPSLLNGSSYKIINGKLSECFKSEKETSQANATPNQGILVHPAAPTMVKLTPVAVSSYTSKFATTFSSNSLIYSASSLTPLSTSDTIEGTIVSIPSSPPTIVSSSTMNASSPQNISESSTTTQAYNTKVTTSDETSTNPPAAYNNQSGDVVESENLINPPQSQVPTSTPNSQSESAPHNSQRVTINMRTFKEEWRKQLLVDYDPRTNMSICMLCFTTFKSYDGPRKNTYVKHAKRFHPALEDYSDEERGVIISMYEKYHKYDIDMQKEINKSFRAPNGSSCPVKRGPKNSDGGIPAQGLNGISSRPDVEVESPDEGSDPANDGPRQQLMDITYSGVTDSAEYFKGKRKLSAMDRSAPESVTSTSNSPIKEMSENKGFSNNNNNSNANKNTITPTPNSHTISTKEKSTSLNSNSVTV